MTTQPELNPQPTIGMDGKPIYPDQDTPENHAVCDGTIAKLARMVVDAETKQFMLAETVKDLLEALQLASKYMELSLGSTYEGENPFPIIEAAISKATGATP